MPLRGGELKAVCSALMEAFGTKEALQRMVRFGLDEHLDRIVIASDLEEIVFELVEWAERNDCVDLLIKAARAENPRSSALQALKVGDTGQKAAETARMVRLPQRRNLYYLEYADTLKRIDTALRDFGQVALHGIGGTGKTQAAFEYASRYAERYTGGVLWIQADSYEATLDSLAALVAEPALALSLPEDATREQRVTAVGEVLRQRSNCLFILDNVDWLFDCDGAEFGVVYPQCVPAGPDSHVLLTSRQEGGDPSLYFLELGTMSPENSALLLARYALKDPALVSLDTLLPAEAQAARELAELLGGLPLALAQAGATVAFDRLMSLKDYLNRYRSQEGETLRKQGAHFGSHRSTYYTFVSALEQVQAQSAVVLEVLGLSAFFAPVPIPLSVYLPAVLDEETQGTVREAVRIAVRYRLLDWDSATQSVIMHRVVKDVVRDVLAQSEGALFEEPPRYYKEYAVNSLSLAFPDSDYANWVLCATLLPHALLGVQYIETEGFTSALAAQLLNQVALYLDRQRGDEEARRLYERALTLCEGLEQPNPILMATVLNNLGNLHNLQGDYKQAVRLFERALSLHRKLPKPGHPYAAAFHNNLAMTYTNMGNFAKALPLFERSLALGEKTGEAESALTAQVLNNLGLTKVYMGDYDSALSLYERAEAMCLRTRGPEHPLTAQVLNNLAFLRFLRGEVEEADRIYHDSLVIYEKTLGPDHPETANALSTQGILRASRGEVDAALGFLERARTALEKMERPRHAELARTLTYLGQAYYYKADYDKAQEMNESALVHYGIAFGPMHPERGLTLNNLGLLLTRKAEFEKAEACFSEAVTIYEKTVGMQHPQAAHVLNNLGLLYFEQSKKTEALTTLRRALTVYEQTIGLENTMAAQCLCNIGMLCAMTEQWDEAEEPLDHALAIIRRVTGPKANVEAQCLMGKAQLLIHKEDFVGAQVLLEQARAQYEATVGLAHPDVATVLIYLAGIYARQGDAPRALELIEPAYQAQSLAFGEQHPNVVLLGELVQTLKSMV